MAGHDYPVYIAKEAPNYAALAPLELEVIEEIAGAFGRKTYGQLWSYIHTPAWQKAFDAKGNKGSAPMKYEDFYEGEEEALEEAKSELLEHARIKQALSDLR